MNITSDLRKNGGHANRVACCCGCFVQEKEERRREREVREREWLRRRWEKGAFRQLMAELQLEVMPLFTACNDNRNSATNHPHFVSSN